MFYTSLLIKENEMATNRNTLRIKKEALFNKFIQDVNALIDESGDMADEVYFEYRAIKTPKNNKTCCIAAKNYISKNKKVVAQKHIIADKLHWSLYKGDLMCFTQIITQKENNEKENANSGKRVS